MKLREAEKAVLEAADRWEKADDDNMFAAEQALHDAVGVYRTVKAAGKPKATCYCGKTVSIEGDHLRGHRGTGTQWDVWHAPTLKEIEAHGGEVKDAAW